MRKGITIPSSIWLIAVFGLLLGVKPLMFAFILPPICLPEFGYKHNNLMHT